jgi:ubiquitin-protein ligase
MFYDGLVGLTQRGVYSARLKLTSEWPKRPPHEIFRETRLTFQIYIRNDLDLSRLIKLCKR